MTIVQVNHFIENYFTHNMNLNGQQQKQYNEDINTIWDDIKDFIRLHYISPRQDKTFGKVSFIQKNIRYFKNKIRYLERSHSFLQIMVDIIFMI